MKKVLFAAFAGVCVISSILATPAGPAKMNSNQRINQITKDTIPHKKDTSRYPKPDTSSMPKVVDLSLR